MSYSLWVLVGLVLSFAAARLQPASRADLPEPARSRVLVAAILGAVAGAYICELPADLMGWSMRPDGVPADGMPMGGRTVLGGILGGWLTVEVVKHWMGIAGPTGDRFALPLAIALACGRLGCASAGCCGGTCCDAWWAWHGRVPVQFIEAVFHGSAALVLGVAAWKGVATGRRLALYLMLYAVLRFALEFWRGNPPVLLGMTWYQILALVLALLASGTWLRRFIMNDHEGGPASAAPPGQPPGQAVERPLSHDRIARHSS